MRRHHLERASTGDPTSASNAVSTSGELTGAKCAGNLALSQLPMSGQNGLPSRRPQLSNRNGDLQHNSSLCLASLCCRAAWSAAPFIVAPPGHGSPVVVNFDLKVANCLPWWRGNPMAITSMARFTVLRDFTLVNHCSGFATHPRQGLGGHRSALQPTRSGTSCPVASRLVEPCAALAPSFCDVQWET